MLLFRKRGGNYGGLFEAAVNKIANSRESIVNIATSNIRRVPKPAIPAPEPESILSDVWGHPLGTKSSVGTKNSPDPGQV
jgi:hypothetical protein